MPSDGACLLVRWESTRQSLSFTLAAIDSERRDIDRPACRVTPSFGRRSFFGKRLKSRSALFAVPPARRGQVCGGWPVPTCPDDFDAFDRDAFDPDAFARPLFRQFGSGACSGSPPLDPVPMRSMGICPKVLGAERDSNTGPSECCWGGVQFGVREHGEHSGLTTAEPNC